MRRIDYSPRLLALEENWILCAIVIAVNAIWHSGMLLIVRYVLTRVMHVKFVHKSRTRPFLSVSVVTTAVHLT